MATEKKSNVDYNKKVKSQDLYALTVTFKYLHCKSPKGQFKETAPYLTKLLSRSTEFWIIPEFRHTTGDIHYHGVIKIKDYIKWHKSTLPSLKSLGFICIKLIHKDKYDGWEEYCKEEIYIAKGLLGDYFPLRSKIEFKQKDLKTKRLMDDYILECLNASSEESVEEKLPLND